MHVLAWHWPDHHWQYNYWWVAWTSSRMYAGKKRTLWATIVTIFSNMTRDVSVFVKCDTIFRLFFSPKLPQIQTSNFRKLVQQRTEYVVFLLEIYFSSAVKEFWKSVKNWQSYRQEFSVLIFFGHSVVDLGILMLTGGSSRRSPATNRCRTATTNKTLTCRTWRTLHVNITTSSRQKHSRESTIHRFM